MSILNKRHELDLTDDEAKVLAKSNVPEEVKRFLSRGAHESIGAQISAWQKVEAAATAQTRALRAIRKLAATKEVGDSELLREIAALHEEREALVAQTEGMREALMRATAVPALAVHSDD